MPDDELLVRLRAVGQTAFNSSMNRAAGSIRGVADSAKNLAKVGGAAAGIFAVGAIVKSTRAGVGYNKMIDSQRVAFETLLGSQKAAAKFMAQIQQLALDSPVLNPQETGDAARLLMAYGVANKKVLPFVKALGDMSAATGKSIAETLPRGAMAVGQIASKGKLQSEELNQLAESVGLSRDRIRKELKMTRDEFAAAFTPGNNISAAKALPAIMRAMEKQSGGAAEKLSKTTAGRLDQLREVFARKMGGLTRGAYDLTGRFAYAITKGLMRFDPAAFLKRVDVLRNALKAGFSSGGGAATAGFSGLAGVFVKVGAGARWVGDMVTSKVFPALKKVLPVLGKGAVSAAKQLFGALKPLGPFIGNVLLPLVKGIAIGVGASLVGAFKIAVPLIKGVATFLGWIGEKAKPVKPIIQGVGTAIGFLFSGGIMGGLAKVGGKIGWIGKVAQRLVTPFKRAGGVIKSAFVSVAGLVSTAWDKVLSKITGVLNGLIDAYNAIPGHADLPRVGGDGTSSSDNDLGGLHGFQNMHNADPGNYPTQSGGPTGNGTGRRSRRRRTAPYARGPETRNIPGFAAPGARAVPRRGGSPLLRVQVPVAIGHRQFSQATADVYADDLARLGK